MADTTVQQRHRTKGWRKPEGSVVVDRTSRWGNPFRVGEEIAATDEEYGLVVWIPQNAHDAVTLFARWLDGVTDLGDDDRREWILDHVHELAGKTLLCWCPQPGPCHAHVLAELADTRRQELDRHLRCTP